MRGVVSIETNQSNTDDGEVDENYCDAPSSTDNSDNEGVNHEANGDSDNADNESSNNENDPPIANALRNPDFNVVHVDRIDDADNRGRDSDNEEEEAHSNSQPQEYDWNYAEQDSISDSDDYDWNFGCEEDQAGTNNSSQNTNTTTQTTNAVRSSDYTDSASANQGEKPNDSKDPMDPKDPNNQKDLNERIEKKDETKDEPSDQVDINDHSSTSDELAKTENDNLKLFHNLELDESKNAESGSMGSTDNPMNAFSLSATQNDQTITDENKMSNDAAKDTSELKFGSTSHDCGRGAIRRTVQSSNRGRDIVNSTSRTAIRKSNQYYYADKKSSFGDPDDYSLRGFEQDYNYADYINICASSYTASNPIESDNFSGYRSPNLSRYGNLNSPGFGDSGEQSYEAEHSAVIETPVNPEHGTIQMPTYSTSDTSYSDGGNPTSLSFGSPVSPSHGIQHTSSDFNTSGYDVPGWLDHRAPYSSPYEGPRSLVYAAPEISNYNTNMPKYSSSRSPQNTGVGPSGFFAPGSSTYDVSASSRYGVSGLTGYVPPRSSNYEVPVSRQYNVPGYSTYGPSPSPSWTSGSSGSEYSALAPSGYSAPISASYGAPELFDYRTSNSYAYSTQSTPVYDAPGYYSYSADYSSFGCCNIGSSGYSASMSPGYNISGSAGYCPSMLPTYSTPHSSSCSASLAPDYGTPHATHRAGYNIPPTPVYRDPGSSGYGISNLSVCVPVPSDYGPPPFSGFGASRSTRHDISRALRYGVSSMPGISPSGVGLGLLAKFDEEIKCGNKANKRDHKAFNRGQRENIANYPVSMFDLGTGPSAGTEYRGFGLIAEATAHDQGAGPVPGPGYGRGRPIRRGRSQMSGPIVPLQEIGNNRGQFGQRPLIEEIHEPGFELGAEPEQTGRGRGRGRGRRENRDGN